MRKGGRRHDCAPFVFILFLFPDLIHSEAAMKHLALSLLVALLLSSPGFAQQTHRRDSDRDLDKDRLEASSAREDEEDPYEEQENVRKLRESIVRDLSDAGGKPRPDLFENAIRHLHRMKVVSAPGPVKEPEPAK
jgi:hypothetical protein